MLPSFPSPLAVHPVPGRPLPFALEFDARAYEHIVSALPSSHETPASWHVLHVAAQQLKTEAASAATVERLLIEEHCADLWRRHGVIPYPYQLNVVRRVLASMNGRAILADEVGLGKTIEAGMIIKEYMLRGLARRVLILVPATLVWQWFAELRDKFGLVATRQRTVYDWERSDVVIASLDTAKRTPHRDVILRQRYDMLVVDEAHRLKDRRSLNWKFVNAIHRHYCLLLTATPVQNSLDELHSLVTLLKPGHLGSSREFQRIFALDARRARDPQQLRAVLSRVMIRHRRGRDTVEFTPRHVHPVPVELTPSERHFYDALTDYVRHEARRTGAFSSQARAIRSLLPLIVLQKEAVSSAAAALLTLHKMLQGSRDDNEQAALQHLLSLGLAVQGHAKADALLELLRQSDEQFIVFTEYRATQHAIQARLDDAGIAHIAFHGGLSFGRREWVREAFRRHARVLVSTESGGEGINFQFCCNVVHFDLPWNPQRIEQRIGRVHRLGQTRPVHVYNLATRDTIEEYILYLLDQKLDLFRQVVGLDEARWTSRVPSFEAAIARIVLTEDSRDAIFASLDKLGSRLAPKANEDPALIDRILGEEA